MPWPARLGISAHCARWDIRSSSPERACISIKLNRFRHTCPVRHSPSPTTRRSGFAVCWPAGTGTPSNEPLLLVRGMQRAQNAHSLRAIQRTVWVKGQPSRSPLKTRLMSPSFQGQGPLAPMPDLPQAIQRADIVGGPSKPSGTAKRALFKYKTLNKVHS
jgi:hypothetical protein